MPLEKLGAQETIGFKEAVEAYAKTPEANLQTYEHFAGEGHARIETKKAFLTQPLSEHGNPQLGLTPVVLRELWRQAHRLNGTLSTIEQNVIVDSLDENAFYELVAQRTAETYFLLQAYRVNDMGPRHPHYYYQATALHELGVELYGEPKLEDFFSITNAERKKAAGLLSKLTDPISRQIVQGYLHLLPEHNPSAPPLYLPQPETVAHYHEVANEIFGDLINTSITDDKREYEPNDMLAIFKRALEHIQADGWQVALREGGTNVDTSQKEKTIYIGSERQEAKAEKMRGLVAHEVGVHVWRRILGEQTPNPLLWNTGLADYYPNEEGLAVVVEQALNNEAEVTGEQHYQNISLSLGLDGKPREFREVYEIEWRRRVVDLLAQGKPVDNEAITKQQSIGYNNVTRIRRGLPTEIAGIAFTKDLAYYNGNVAMWQYLEKELLPVEEFKKLLIGKFDPTRVDHRQIQVAALSQSR